MTTAHHHRTTLARAAAFVAVAALALVGCTEELSPLEQAQAQVTAKEKAVNDAEATFATASAAFCPMTKDYIEALDVYGDLITDTAPTVGDVQNAGADLVAPRDEAVGAAQAAVDAQNAFVTAQRELIDAQEALAVAQAGPSGTPSPVDATEPSATPLAPADSVARVKEAEKDFSSTASGIDASTPLREASEQFHAAAVALELSWIKLFVDTGCATDEQAKRATEEVAAYTTALQQDLKDAGYYKGAVDGIYGPQTVQAVEDLQKAHDLPQTGVMDRSSVEALHADLVKLGLAEAEESLATTAALQQTLKLLGLWDEPVDGVWTDELTEALKELQTKLGVEPTGEVDTETVAAFQEALAKLQELVASASPSPSPSPSPSVTPTS